MKKLQLYNSDYKPELLAKFKKVHIGTTEVVEDVIQPSSNLNTTVAAPHIYVESRAIQPKYNIQNVDSLYRKTLLINQVYYVRSFLNALGLGHIKFFVAGGSIFSILQCTNHYFDDIDVYFYNKNDIEIILDRVIELKPELSELVELFVTPNAISFSPKSVYSLGKALSNNVIKNFDRLEQKIQAIMIKFGSPEEVLNSFDFNCAKCCITSDLELQLDDTFNKNIELSVNIYHVELLHRYNKYIHHKAAVDPGNKTLFQIIDYMVENYEEILEKTYNGGSYKKTALNALSGYLYGCKDSTITDYVLDKVCSYHDADERFKIFKILQPSFYVLTKSCIENNFYRYEAFVSSSYPSLEKMEQHRDLPEMTEDDIREVLSTYPEYFI